MKSGVNLSDNYRREIEDITELNKEFKPIREATYRIVSGEENVLML